MLEFYAFNVGGIGLSGFDLVEIVRLCREGKGNFRYRLYESKIVFNVVCGKEVAEIGYQGVKRVVYFDEVEEIIRSDKSSWVFELSSDGRLRPLGFYTGDGFVKLKAVMPRHSTTIEINGIHMHRIVGMTPFQDAKLKVLRAGIRASDVVLDTCTGLGYTAINSIDTGAKKVFTVEINEYVLYLAERNPWSWRLGDNRVSIILGDITRVVSHFPENYFDVIIHDPPTILVAGELYSFSLYLEFYRLLRPRGRLLHYIGETGKHGRMNVLKGVAKRLKSAGFVVRSYDRRTGSVIAVKI